MPSVESDTFSRSTVSIGEILRHMEIHLFLEEKVIPFREIIRQLLEE